MTVESRRGFGLEDRFEVYWGLRDDSQSFLRTFGRGIPVDHDNWSAQRDSAERHLNIGMGEQVYIRNHFIQRGPYRDGLRDECPNTNYRGLGVWVAWELEIDPDDTYATERAMRDRAIQHIPPSTLDDIVAVVSSSVFRVDDDAPKNNFLVSPEDTVPAIDIRELGRINSIHLLKAFLEEAIRRHNVPKFKTPNTRGTDQEMEAENFNTQLEAARIMVELAILRVWQIADPVEADELSKQWLDNYTLPTLIPCLRSCSMFFAVTWPWSSTTGQSLHVSPR